MKHKPQHHKYQPDARFCGGKRRYSSRQEAERIREEQELLTVDLRLNIYRCGCGGWHLTRSRDEG